MTKPRILIIENQTAEAGDIADRLARLGYEVAGTAASGEEALAIAERERPNMALAEIRLDGGLDGIQTAERLRARYDVPVIFLTAEAGAAAVERARAAEPFGYLVKPVEDRQLHAALEVAINKHRTEKALHELKELAASQRAHAERRLREAQTLRKIDMAVGASFDVRLTLNAALDEILASLEMDAAVVLLLNWQTQALEFAAGRGLHGRSIERARLRPGDGLAGRAAGERRLIAVKDIPSQAAKFAPSELDSLASEGFVVCYAAPLVARHYVTGVLELFRRAPFEPDRMWLEYVDALAVEVALAVDSARILEDLQRSNARLTHAYDATLEAWARSLDRWEQEADHHTRHIAELTVRLGQALGMGHADLLHMRRGVLLHDIGKMSIPDATLRKAEVLSEQEWVNIRMHPVYAFEILAPIELLRPALDIPYCHHERWDGTGYPRGLKGEQIPLAARIFAVVDVWDALRNDRPYRKRWSDSEAIQHIQSHSGRHFDPQVVSAFLGIVEGERAEESHHE